MSGTFNDVIQLVYLLAASCFVLGLHLMNTPATARRGNQVSVAGMAAAIAATTNSWIGYVIAFVAAMFASANVVGGYVVTGRMLKMFRKRPTAPVAPAAEAAASRNGQAS